MTLHFPSAPFPYKLEDRLHLHMAEIGKGLFLGVALAAPKPEACLIYSGKVKSLPCLAAVLRNSRQKFSAVQHKVTSCLSTVSTLMLVASVHMLEYKAEDRNKGKPASPRARIQADIPSKQGDLLFLDSGSGCKHRPVSLHSSGSPVEMHTGCLFQAFQ